MMAEQPTCQRQAHHFAQGLFDNVLKCLALRTVEERPADRARGGVPGLGLIEFGARGSNNRRPIFLTKKGRSVAAAILKSVRSPYPQIARAEQAEEAAKQKQWNGALATYKSVFDK
jgi:hypothetical protein